MRTIEQSNGVAYQHNGTVILFPYGTGPKALFGNGWATIDEPERFGGWETRAERHQYVLAFIGGRK